MTLGSLFEMVVSRSKPSVQEHLDKDHHLEESGVGSTKDMLDCVGDTGMCKYHLRGFINIPRLLAQCVGLFIDCHMKNYSHLWVSM